GPFGASPSGGHSPSFGAVDPSLAADPGVARADELARAGLNTLAGVELDLVDGPLISKLGSSRVVPSLIDRYEKADDFFRVHRLAEAHSGGALKLDPH